MLARSQADQEHCTVDLLQATRTALATGQPGRGISELLSATDYAPLALSNRRLSLKDSSPKGGVWHLHVNTTSHQFVNHLIDTPISCVLASSRPNPQHVVVSLIRGSLSIVFHYPRSLKSFANVIWERVTLPHHSRVITSRSAYNIFHRGQSLFKDTGSFRKHSNSRTQHRVGRVRHRKRQ